MDDGAQVNNIADYDARAGDAADGAEEDGQPVEEPLVPRHACVAR